MALAGLPLMLLLGALARIPGSEGGKETPAHFLYQAKSECRFFNGTQRVRLLQSYISDRQEFMRFDSDRGKFLAVTPLGKPAVDRWNGDKQVMQIWKAQVDRFCRHNYRLLNYQAPKREEQVVGRRGPLQPPQGHVVQIQMLGNTLVLVTVTASRSHVTPFVTF